MRIDPLTIAAEAYQVIGVLVADCPQLRDNPSVVEALDYFSNIANGGEKGEILPFEVRDE